MPKVIILQNQSIGVEKGTEIDQQQSADQGAPVVVDTWTMIFVDRTYGDRTTITFNRETRDDIVRQLTGGIVLAGGELPSV